MKINKKLTLALAAMCLSGTAMAWEKGNFFGVSGEFESGGQSDSKSANVFYGKFLKPNLAGKLGLILMEQSGTKSMGLGVGAQYYLKPLGKAGDAVPFVGGDLFSMKMDGGGFSSTYTQLEGNGGMAYFLSEMASVDFKAFFRNKSGTGSSSTSTGVNVEMRYYF